MQLSISMSCRDFSEAMWSSSMKTSREGFRPIFPTDERAAFWQAAAAELARPVDLESLESRASHPSGSALAIFQPLVAAEFWPAVGFCSASTVGRSNKMRWRRLLLAMAAGHSA